MVELKDKTKLYAANRLQSLRQKIGPANAEARRTGDYSEVYKLYVELEKLSDVKNLQTQEAFQSYVQDEARTTSLDVAKSAGSGIARGLTYAAALPNLAENVIGYGGNQALRVLGSPAYDPEQPFFQENTLAPGLDQIQQFATENIPGASSALNFAPQTTTGEYAQSIGEFASPFGLIGTAGKVASVVGGVTFETAEQLGAGPLMSTGVSLAAILTGNYAMSFNKASKIAEMSLKGVSKQEIIAAAELEKKFNASGIPVTANELLDSDYLDGIFTLISKQSGKSGETIETYLKNRPNELNNLVNSLMDKILKDKGSAKKLGFEDLNTTINETMARIKKKRGLESQQAGYNIGDTEFLPKQLMDDILKEIDVASTTGSQNASKLNLLKEFKKSLTGADGKPLTNIGDLAGVFKIYRDKINTPSTSPNSLEDFLKNILKDPKNPGNGLIERLESALKTNKNYKKGNDTYEALSKQVDENFAYLNFSKTSKIDVNDIKELIFNTDSVNVKDIQNLAKILRENVSKQKVTETVGGVQGSGFNMGGKSLPLVQAAEDPFAMFVNAYMKNIYNKTFAEGFKGKIPQNAGFNFNKKMFPTLASQVNFKAIIKEIAKEKKVNADDLLQGWKNFSEIAERTGAKIKTQGGIPNMGTSIEGEVLKLGSLMWRIRFAQGIVRYRTEKTAVTLSKVFTDDNSINALVKLANNKTDVKAINRIATALTPIRAGDEKTDVTVSKQDMIDFINSKKTKNNNEEIN